jgi:hypothetical protein
MVSTLGGTSSTSSADEFNFLAPASTIESPTSPWWANLARNPVATLLESPEAPASSPVAEAPALVGAPRVNRFSGAITFTTRVSTPGLLSWAASFQQRGQRTGARVCARGAAGAQSSCRPRTIVVGAGSKRVLAAGEVSFTLTPTVSARQALHAASSNGTTPKVRATIGLQAAGGGPVISRAYTVTDELRARHRAR